MSIHIWMNVVANDDMGAGWQSAFGLTWISQVWANVLNFSFASANHILLIGIERRTHSWEERKKSAGGHFDECLPSYFLNWTIEAWGAVNRKMVGVPAIDSLIETHFIQQKFHANCKNRNCSNSVRKSIKLDQKKYEDFHKSNWLLLKSHSPSKCECVKIHFQ